MSNSLPYSIDACGPLGLWILGAPTQAFRYLQAGWVGVEAANVEGTG